MIRSIKNGPFELDLTPEFGGSVSAFRAYGTDVLRCARPMNITDWDARNSAAFPMLPFVGRITNGGFMLNRQSIQLDANMPPEPHAIHGFGWQRAWRVLDASGNYASLEQIYSEQGWPWPYRAQQTFALEDDGLSLTLSIRNQGETPMPAGLGWHPYFPSHQTMMEAPVTRCWTGENTQPERADLDQNTNLRYQRAAQSLNLDMAFDTENAPIAITTTHHVIALTSDPVFSKLTVYAPIDADFICIEPITHAPDALNITLPDRETGLIWLDPGETLNGQISLTVKPRSNGAHSA